MTCYNALLNAHAEDAGAVGCPGRRCEDVLRALEAAGLRPDAHTYGTLVKAWGRSATSDAAERAQRYAAEMDAADGAGGGGGREGRDRRAVVQNAVMHAWSRSDSPAAQDALAAGVRSAEAEGRADQYTYKPYGDTGVG